MRIEDARVQFFHLSRREPCGTTLEVVREWREVGAVIQTDATMLMASGPMARLAQAMLAQGLIDCLASDNHGDNRSLAAARLAAQTATPYRCRRG